jgi:hypothetical protein
MKNKRNLFWFLLFVGLVAAIIGLPNAFLFIIRKDAQEDQLTMKEITPIPDKQSKINSTPLAIASPQEQQSSSRFDAPFRTWLTEYSSLPADSPEREKELQEGIALAKARRPPMEKLIRENPRLAIENSLGFHEWSLLPEPIKNEVERPFSVTSEFSRYPICRQPGESLQAVGATSVSYLALSDGANLRIFSYGLRSTVFSKRALPVQGIALGKVAAMRDGSIQIIDGKELAAVQKLFPNGQSDMGRSFSSGLSVSENGVHALSGGKIYRFANQNEIQVIEQQLVDLDALPGPYAASSILASPGGFQNPNGVLNLPQIRVHAKSQASSWTETKKRLFMIRIDFPDKPGEPVAKDSLQDSMDRASGEILKMSYGKTWVESAVSEHVYTLPKNSTEYDDDEDSIMLRDARNIFRSIKRGLDQSIKIGPESHTGTGSGAGLGDYDIVGIYFVNLGRKSEFGFVWGGRAWAEDLWIQGNKNEDLIIHEWGHNYCINHASLWKTTDGSVTGKGTSVEYGDPFDYMGDGPFPGAHFHPEAKSRLNWLTSAGWADVDTLGPGTYRIYSIDDPLISSGFRGLRVARGGNASAHGYYWVGHRGAFTDNFSISNGAYLIWQRPGGDRSWLLDTTPTSIEGAEDSALALGQTFADPLSALTITPIARGNSKSVSYIDVQVNIGPPAPPTGLTAKIISAVEIYLSWQPIPGALEYYILRDGNQIATVPALTYTDTLELPTSYFYEDKTAKPSSTHKYVIVAVNSLGSSESQPVTVSMPASSAGVYIANFNQESIIGQIFIKKSHGGTFTGTLVTPQGKSSFRGSFDSNGNAAVTLGRGIAVLDLNLIQIGLDDGKWDESDDVYISSNLIINNSNVLTICRSAPKKKGPSAPIANQRVNALLETRKSSGIFFGHGFASLNAGKDGVIRATGALPDGSKLSGSFYMVQDGTGGWILPTAVFISASKSFLHGQAIINSNPETEAFHLQSSAPWTWTRPPNAKAKTFAAGFKEELDVNGRVWSWTKGTSALGGSSANFTLTLSAPSGFEITSGAESLSGSLSASNKPTWSSAPPKGFTMKITPASGLVSGKVPGIINGKAKTLSYQGLIFPRDMELDSGTPVRGAGFMSGSGASGTMEMVAP